MRPLGCLWGLLMFVLICVISWWVLYGVLYLICWCFNLAFFGWKVVTGIWLLMWLLGGLFK